MKRSIRTKLPAVLVATMVLMLLMLALIGFALAQMSMMHQKMDFVVNQTILSIDLVHSMNETLLNYRARQMEYIINAAPADKQRIEQELKEINDTMGAIFHRYEREYQPNDDELDAFRSMKANWNWFVERTETEFLPANRESDPGNSYLSYGRLSPLYGSVQNDIRRMEEQSQARAEAARARVETAYANFRSLAVIASALILLLLVVTGAATRQMLSADSAC